jgi:RimJ/RimL family protein N-acetyltransferase/predicted Rossmann-fold nucleotide-binding protein
MEFRRKVIAVVGDGANPYRDRSIVLGEWIAQSGYHLLTGGGGGVMTAVTESFVECIGHKGIAIGVIPGSIVHRGDRFEYRTKGSAYPNYALDLAVFTHLPGEDPEGERSRNHINVLSADLVVALPGGIGTHSEIQIAKRYGKPVLLFMKDTDKILDKTAGDLAAEGFPVISDFVNLRAAATRILEPERGVRRPVRIGLEKCVIRSWTWDDAESLQRHANNRKIWRNLHDGFPSPYTIRDARRWLTHSLSSSSETNLAIEVGRQAVGGIGFVPKDGPSSRSAEVGYWLGEEYWGQGIATDCVRAIVTYAFANRPELCRLYAQVFEWNGASMRVLEKAGFTRECILKKAAVKAGDVIDLVQYALIR